MTTPIRQLSLCLQTPGCLPVLMWGDFGIGKTSQTLALADALGWDCELLRPAERGEGALGVVPVPSEDRKVLHYPMPDWAARLAASERPSLLFLDEISSCPPALQPAIMGLALDGIIAGQRLPERVKRVAAGNPTEQAAGGWELAPALANRFVHLTWPAPKADEWTAWLTGNSTSSSVTRLDLDAFEAEWGKAKALGAAFIRSHPMSLHEDMSKTLGRTPPAFATPRSWETALRLLAACRASGSMDIYPALAEGSLGPTVAMQGVGGDPAGSWLVWLRDNDLPDPEDLLASPRLLKDIHDPKRPDRTFATLLAVAEAGLATVNGNKLTTPQRWERWQQAFAVLKVGLDMDLGKDVVLLPARALVRADRRPDVKWQDQQKDPPSQQVCRILQVFNDMIVGQGDRKKGARS